MGHHANDLAETLFINICRGTGIKGLTGIRPVKDRILRPLLSRSREEIIAYIEQNQLGYRTDSTNNSLDYVRNKIRHMIIPVCKDINPRSSTRYGKTVTPSRKWSKSTVTASIV